MMRRTAEVKAGDIAMMPPFSKISVDGEVIEGESQVDESLLTSKSMVVNNSVGATVIGATINKSDSSVIALRR